MSEQFMSERFRLVGPEKGAHRLDWALGRLRLEE